MDVYSSFNDVSFIHKGDYIKLERVDDDEEWDDEECNDKKYEAKLRPEIEIALAVNENKDINRDILSGSNYDGTNPHPTGLSYQQIYKIIGEVGDSRFSEGMDIAVDIGYLKPITVFDGIKVVSKNERKSFEAIVRLYTPAMEDVSKSLKCFLRLITPTG